MRILVTGGAGYIGSILVPMLLAEGYRVVVLDNLMYDQDTLLDCIAFYPDRFDFVPGDTRNPKAIDGIYSKYEPECVIPLAAIVGADACDKSPETSNTVNIGGVMEACQRWIGSSMPKVIFPNTNSGYGIGQNDIHCSEESPLKPISLYGRQKVEAERWVLERGNSIVLRLATVFGVSPRMRTDLLVNDFVSMAIKPGNIELSEKHFIRNYIHVKDVARGFIHCLKNFDKMKGQVYNLGLSDANLSKWELCEEIRKQIPGLRTYDNESRKDPDQRNYIVSNSKIEATGFMPNYSLQYGIAELIKGYQIIRINKYKNI